MDLLKLPIAELVERVRRNETSATELTRASLARIAERSDLGAFLTVNEEGALRDAAEIDARRARGEALGALAGVPVAVKDALATHDQPTTAASKILLREVSDPPDPRRGYVPPYDATVVERLRAADAVLVGKTNMDEFAMGSSNENSAFFVARNPHDPTRTPGGSSGGSAVAVAAGMVPLAIGSDTGGSIRQPASLCGVVGLKPTYGRVSRYGLFAFASSLDQVGVFTGDAASAALALGVIGGHDARDATSAPRGVDDVVGTDTGVSGLRVGVPREYFGEGIAPGVAKVVRAAIDDLARRGATIVDVSLPTTRFGVAAYYVLATAEASSNLARYDGVRFGLREVGGSLAELYKKSRGAGFGDEVKRRIILGTFVLSSGYYDAYYVRAQRVRARIAEDFTRVFAEVDVLATPTSPTVAFALGSKQGDPLAMYLADVCTLPASLAGVPAVSIPCGKATPEDGGPALPVGLQLIAPHFHEARLFRVAAAITADAMEAGAAASDAP